MSESDKICEASIEVPPIKTAWLDIQCVPCRINHGLMRLKITLNINGEPFQNLVNTLFDATPGNGIIMQSNNLTWMKEKFI